MVGAQRCPLGLHALWGLRAAGPAGGHSRGGWLAAVVRGVWCQALSSPGRSSSGAGSRGSATPVFRVRSVRAWGPSTAPTACALAGRRCSLWEWQKGVPRGGAFHRCEGRPGSGAPTPRTARPLDGLFGSVTHMLWARACGCGAHHCPLGLHALSERRAAEVVGGRAQGGWPATVVRGQALSLPLPPVLWGGRPGFSDPYVPGAVGAGMGTQQRPHSVRPCGPALLAVGVAEGRPRGRCLPLLRGASEVRRSPSPGCPPTGRAVGVRYPRAGGMGVWVRGPNTVPLACMPCGGCVPRRWRGAVLGGGWPATVVRGVWCQALSFPRLPVLWGGQPGYRDPCVQGAVGAGVGPSTSSTACALAGWRCLLWRWRKGVPEGVPSTVARGVCGQALPLPRLPAHWGGLLGSATQVLWARACGCGGPTLSPWPAYPARVACRGGGGGPSPGGVACHCCEGRLVSGAVSPPDARPLGRAARVPRPMCPRCGRCGRGDPAPAPRRVGVAEGRPWGGVLCTVVRGVCRQALPLPRLPAHWAGCWGPPPTCSGRGRLGVGAQHCRLGLHALRGLRAAGVVGGRPRGGCLPPL